MRSIRLVVLVVAGWALPSLYAQQVGDPTPSDATEPSTPIWTFPPTPILVEDPNTVYNDTTTSDTATTADTTIPDDAGLAADPCQIFATATYPDLSVQVCDTSVAQAPVIVDGEYYPVIIGLAYNST